MITNRYLTHQVWIHLRDAEERSMSFLQLQRGFSLILSMLKCLSAIPRDCLKGVEFVPDCIQHLKSQVEIYSYGRALRCGVCQKGLRLRRAQLPGDFQDPSSPQKIPSPNTLSPPPQKKKRLHLIYFFLSPRTAQRTSV